MMDIPKLYDTSLDKINHSIILDIIKTISDKKDFVITPINILKATGFPVADQTILLGNKAKIKKIKKILIDLENEGVIEQRKSKQDYLGIKETAYNLTRLRVYDRTIEQLENDYWKEPNKFPTSLVEKCHRYRQIRIDHLTTEQIRLLISQQIGSKYLIGIALEKLNQNILTEGDLYEGDLLVAVSGLPTEFWLENRYAHWTIKNLIAQNSDLIISEMGEKKFDQLTEKINASAQHHL